ncbi:beta-ketoacyl-ACP synthase III [Streptococcus ruminantium]|uniref:Beta-ketoacyl-[acyl-carrier-protein] synthase III n=1 Tax=Streptococcus ruminantium TaxID=1917441 RepID=A0ABU1B4Y9_9STRE|nr:beta-ketoacyl-ACP synthase III [Streptococcus ruminantium]MDQ8760181.1 beta-ketoacyl-ACP synthase III [Streptococcus ruminantium]MDQ8764829.1 beta-ketoacyl-ACP synthase III [Streptococcus ruminantium]MDQ8769727.1 beta-ketoacyl-ACP synthase III [Streptococcus ruminantium]MDQ8775564.1 beta-ketoacyl-ACP synthase III [Streptococcus ruminantium]MDQ8794696.1 beta-ketoacyl-ACP synthase III [Streptococcus ruminantium]
MRTYAKISQVAHYLPEKIVTNDDLAQLMDTSDDWIRGRTGIRQRHVVIEETTSDLASQVARQLLEKAQLDANDIDFIILATITPDSSMPSTAALVQEKIGAKRAFAYDLVAACSGFVFGLSTAEKLIASGVYKRGIVLGAEVLSKAVDWSDRSTAVLFGDGAGGVLLEASTHPSFLSEILRTDGGRGASLTAGIHQEGTPFSPKSFHEPHIRMEGRSIFEFATRDVTATMAELLDQYGMSAGQVDYFLLHQANIRILDKMAKKLGVNRDKFPANMDKYGNTSAASLPILLSECVEEGVLRLDGSQTVVMTGFGGGLTWGTLLLQL